MLQRQGQELSIPTLKMREIEKILHTPQCAYV